MQRLCTVSIASFEKKIRKALTDRSCIYNPSGNIGETKLSNEAGINYSTLFVGKIIVTACSHTLMIEACHS